LIDIVFPAGCDDGTLPEDSALWKWSHFMMEAAEKFHRGIDSATRYKEYLEELGFTDVVETKHKWPQNTWPKDKKYKELGTFDPLHDLPYLVTLYQGVLYWANSQVGMWTVENMTTGLQGLSLALFTRGLGWSPEELEVFLADVRKDMKTTRYHAYWNM
jgi:hypothetical protein